MEAYKVTSLFFVAVSLISSCQASACSSDKDCFHFEYCCKGNCTWSKLKCEHICQSDHECGSESRCLLGICVNCTNDLSCTRKSCLNNSHCPEGHSCEKKSCEVKKKSNLTSEMAPFLIFIAALSVSLLIVCYNDYFLERFGQRRWRERLESLSCNCSLTLWFWMWRLRRSHRQANGDSSCPGIEVQFDSWSNNDSSNSFNEKPSSRQTIWSWRSFKRILFFWRTNCEDIERFSSPLESNNREHLTRNVWSSNPVILLNGFMNSNEPVTSSSSSNHHSTSLTEQDQSHRSESGQNTTQNDLNSSCTLLDSNGLGTETVITRSSDQESDANNFVNTCSREVTTV